MSSNTGPPSFIPFTDNATNVGAMASPPDVITERMREQWAKCREVQEILGRIKIRDVICALGISEVQAAELQGCIFTLLITGPTSHCFAPERMLLRLAKERWSDLPFWDEIPSIWLTEAMHECVELVKRGGNLAKVVKDLGVQPGGQQVFDKTTQSVSHDESLADQHSDNLDQIQKSAEKPSSAAASGDEATDACTTLLSKDSDRMIEDHHETSSDESSGPMLGLDDESESHQVGDPQRDESTAVCIQTPARKNSIQESLDSSMQIISGHESPQNTVLLSSSSPGLFVTPERDDKMNGSADEVLTEESLSDVVDMTAVEEGENSRHEANPGKYARQSPEHRFARIILDCKFDKILNRQMYLVRWAGYPDTDDSWELIEHLTEYLWLVVDYNKRKATKQSSELESGVASAGTSRPDSTLAHADTQKLPTERKRKVIPANHFLLKRLGQSSDSVTELKSPVNTNRTGEGTKSALQASSQPGDERGPVGDLFLRNLGSSTQSVEDPCGTESTVVESIKKTTPAPSSAYSESRLLPISSPIAPLGTMPPLAVAEFSSTQSKDAGRPSPATPSIIDKAHNVVKSDSPSDTPLQKMSRPAFPVVGPGWRKLAKMTSVRSHSSSPSPIRSDLREPTPSNVDGKPDGGSRRNGACDEAPQQARRASTDRILPATSQRKTQDKAESGPFKHIKFTKNSKLAAPGCDNVQSGEKSFYKQQLSLDETSSKDSSATANRPVFQPTTQKTKAPNVIKPEEYQVDWLLSKPAKISFNITRKPTKPAPTAQEPHRPIKTLFKVKSSGVRKTSDSLGSTTNKDAQTSHASNAASAPASKKLKNTAGLDRLLPTNSQVQRPSTQATNQAGLKRKRSGDDLLAATKAPKRTNFFGP